MCCREFHLKPSQSNKSQINLSMWNNLKQINGMIHGFQGTGHQAVEILKIQEINLASPVMAYNHLKAYSLERGSRPESREVIPDGSWWTPLGNCIRFFREFSSTLIKTYKTEKEPPERIKGNSAGHSSRSWKGAYFNQTDQKNSWSMSIELYSQGVSCEQRGVTSHRLSIAPITPYKL